MQIFRWLFKLADEQRASQSSPSAINKEGQAGRSKDILLFKQRRSKSKKFRVFSILCRRDVAEACFLSTLYLKRVGSSKRRRHWEKSMKMKKESAGREVAGCARSDSATHGGNKVQPLSEVAQSPSTGTNDHRSSTEKKEKPKGDKTKTMSRMKELLRWAAAAKSEKGGKFIGRKVLQFRSRVALKAVPDDDHLTTNESPKISFRWDLESCSTTSSAHTGISVASSLRNGQTCNSVSVSSTPVHDRDYHFNAKRGNWITTDSEFVVLEL